MAGPKMTRNEPKVSQSAGGWARGMRLPGEGDLGKENPSRVGPALG